MSRPCPPLVLLLAAPLNSVNSVAGLCGWALQALFLVLAAPLNSFWALRLSRPSPPELCQLCGWAVWLGSVSRPCPPLSSSAPLNSVNSVAGLCGWALCPGLVLLLSSSWLRVHPLLLVLTNRNLNIGSGWGGLYIQENMNGPFIIRYLQLARSSSSSTENPRRVRGAYLKHSANFHDRPPA